MTKRNGFAVVLFALVGMSAGAVQAATYTWTQNATGTHDWATGANWASSTPFDSGDANELKFFADTTTRLPVSVQTVNNVPSALSMNTLTLAGRGPENPAGHLITIGDSSSTWMIGDGTTSRINLDFASGGTFFWDVRYTIHPNLTLNQTATTFTGNGSSVAGAVFTGNITESIAGSGITKSGSSRLAFAGNNSYSGTTTVSGGQLRLNSATALPGGVGASGGTSALILNGGVLELGAGDFQRNLGLGSDQFRITGGASGFGARNALRVVAANENLELQWGSTHFAPSALVLNTLDAENTLWLENNLDLNGVTRTIQVDGNVAVAAGDIRTASGTAGLTKSGAGTLVLTGNNTYNGTTTLNAGVLSVETANNFGSGASNLILDGGTLQIRGTTLTSLSGLGHTVTITISKNVGFDILSAANIFTADQVLNNNSGTRTLTKNGAGTLVLNQDNTFTGTTTATGGGTLVLDYTTNNGSKLSNSAALILGGTAGGSVIALKGGSHPEVVSGTTLAPGASFITRPDGDAGTSKLLLGTITRGVGTANGSNMSFLDGTVANGAFASLTPPVIGGWATVGSDFAMTNEFGNIVAYSGPTTPLPSSGTGNSAINYTLTGDQAQTGTSILGAFTLKITGTGSTDNTLALGGSGIRLQSNNDRNIGGILYTGGGTGVYNITADSANGIDTTNGGRDLIINTVTGTLHISARLNASFSTGTLLKAGAGTLVLSSTASVFDGVVYVNEGALRLASANAAGTVAGGIRVQYGAALELSNNIIVGTEALTIAGSGIANGGALRNHSGDNSYGGVITLGGDGARIMADSGSMTLTGSIITSGAQTLAIGGAGDITVGGAPAINGAASLVKEGAGALELVVTDSSIPSTCGDLTLDAGTLAITFDIAPSDTVPVLKVMGDLTIDAAATLAISLGDGVTLGDDPYLLFTVGGSAPTAVPTLTGLSGQSLAWGGTDNKTLLLVPAAEGTIIIIE